MMRTKGKNKYYLVVSKDKGYTYGAFPYTDQGLEDAKAYAEKSCYGDGVAYLVTDDLDWDWDLEDDIPEESWRDYVEDDGQPDEYTEWQDVYGGDDWDQGQFDDDVDF